LESRCGHLAPASTISLADGLDFVVISDDEILVQFGTRSYPSELLRDTDLTGILGKLIGRLRNNRAVTIDELISDLRPQDRAQMCQLIDDLLERGFLSETHKNPVEQYLNYTFKGESTLPTRSVSVIGAGPIGARVSHSLLQHGVGRIALLDERKADDLWRAAVSFEVDRNRTDITDVHVELHGRLNTLGFRNVEVLDGRFDAASVQNAVEKSQFTILALEQPNPRLAHLVNRCCIRQRKPWLLTTIDGNFGLIGPLFLPVHTACYNDYATLSDAASRTPLISYRYRQHLLERDASSFFPGLPAYADLVAGYASLASIHFLLRDTSFALGRVLTIDFDRMLIDTEDVLKLPRCPVCGDDKIAYQPPISAEIVTRYASMKNAPPNNIPE
jgi:bacteriocin biosynthesis cyclodehydratase domain-containing protein